MSEQEMVISLVCLGNLKALRQTKNLNLKSIDKLVYVFITILKFGIGLVLLSLANQLANFIQCLRSCCLMELGHFISKTAQIKVITVTTR